MSHSQHLRAKLPVLLLAVLFAFAPLFVSAQESDLDATIRAALLSDPRSVSLSEAEIDALVSALTEEAERQGVTSYDIAWRPQPVGGSSSASWDTSACGNPSGFLCAVSTAFGFTGPDAIIAVALGVVSAILLFVIGMMLYRRGHHAYHGKFPGPAADSLYS
jgi:hypothetical protein